MVICDTGTDCDADVVCDFGVGCDADVICNTIHVSHPHPVLVCHSCIVVFCDAATDYETDVVCETDITCNTKTCLSCAFCAYP